MAPMFPGQDPSVLEQFQVEATYGKLYPLMMNDFRELNDCIGIHKPGNMLVTGQAGQYTLTGAFVTGYLAAISDNTCPCAKQKLSVRNENIKKGETAIEGFASSLG